MAFPLKLDKLAIAEYAADFMIYFERHKLLDILTRLVAEIGLEKPENASVWMAVNIKRIADEVYSNCLRNSYKPCSADPNLYQIPWRFSYRVVIFGRRGSGRKTQARLLMKRFHLVYVDVDQLAYEQMTATDALALEFQQAFIKSDTKAKSLIISKLISRRLVAMDALRQGWVMVNYPRNLEELQDVFENFKVPPNKFVHLRCPQQCAMLRLSHQKHLGRPKDKMVYLEKEMQYFNEHEPEMAEYLDRRHETISINGKPCSGSVKNALLTKLTCGSYIMGFKN